MMNSVVTRDRCADKRGQLEIHHYIHLESLTIRVIAYPDCTLAPPYDQHRHRFQPQPTPSHRLHVPGSDLAPELTKQPGYIYIMYIYVYIGLYIDAFRGTSTVYERQPLYLISVQIHVNS